MIDIKKITQHFFEQYTNVSVESAEVYLLEKIRENPTIVELHHALAFAYEISTSNRFDFVCTSKLMSFGEYQVGLLPANHQLDYLQSVWKRYDKPLMDIIDIMEDLGVKPMLIDIGANVGDTMMWANSKFRVPTLCIEGSDDFISYLEYNAKRVGPWVAVSKNFVGTQEKEIFAKGLQRNPGTLSVEVINATNSTFGILSKSLEHIIEENNYFNNFNLLKIDTDGFDFLIILANLNLINRIKPIIYFECDPSFTASGDEQAKNVFVQLSILGYDSYFIFDNFGNLICTLDGSESSLHIFNDLLKWLSSNRKNGVSVYYLDILCIPNIDKYKDNFDYIKTRIQNA